MASSDPMKKLVLAPLVALLLACSNDPGAGEDAPILSDAPPITSADPAPAGTGTSTANPAPTPAPACDPLSPRTKPLVLAVRVKDLGGPWTVDNLEMLPAVRLQIDDVGDEEGVRDLQYDPSRKAFLVVVGNSTSASKGPFRMYLWDGGESGAVRAFGGLWFAPKMKPEGVTHGTVGGRGATVFADDAGGYAVLWDDDARARAS